MRFFISGEIHTDVGDAFADVRNAVEAKLNGFFAERDYGSMMVELAVIPIILPPDWGLDRPERRLFQRKQRTADYRTRIDYARFLAGDDRSRTALLVRNILDAINDASRKAGTQFRGAALSEDVAALFAAELDARS